MFDLKNLQTNDAGAVDEPPASFWRERASYDALLRRDVIAVLSEAAHATGQPPAALQRAVLQRLHWYFTVDARARAPTLAVDPALADAFHQRMHEAMQYIDATCIEQLSADVGVETRNALLSYKQLKMHSSIGVDRLDRDQGVIRVTYWVHGAPPAERFIVDGAEIRPAYGKLRGCKYFGRILFRQRIAWLPVSASARSLCVELGGSAAQLQVGAPPFTAARQRSVTSAELPLSRVRELLPRGKGGAPSGIAWRARLVKALARLPFATRQYRNAWVFVDREERADDNAEQQYRWLRSAHPEINAWFLLDEDSPDWERLARDGFRLMPPGLRRSLLLLNAAHVVASQPDYAFGKLDRAQYGDAMRWRFTYLKHGVMANDQSHYYADREFDCVIAPSPAERDALVADDTPYELTSREVRLINLPRYDRLLRLAESVQPAARNEVIVMPTWRNNLLDERSGAADQMLRLQRIADSEYGAAWRRVLGDASLLAALRDCGCRLVFVPHANLVPFLAAFALPDAVEIAETGSESIQAHLARCCAFITDYSSVAFDAALLRHPVFYYQFDRERFYGGDHNWRPGYFDYDRDGFGPVAFTHQQLHQRLIAFLAGDREPDAGYRTRMEHALPDQNADACERVHAAMLALRMPYVTGLAQRAAQPGGV